MAAREGFNVEKLRESIFYVCKLNMELLLAFSELDDHFSDPQASSNTNELKEWKQNDAKEKAVILLSLSNEHLEHIWRAGSAFDMWKDLMDFLRRRTFLNRLAAS